MEIDSDGSDPHLPDMRIVLLGNREAGKSSAGNVILGREEFDPDVRTVQCVKRQAEVAGRWVTVVDTPGWTDHDPKLYKDSPNILKEEIVHSVTLCPPGPHAFLLVIHENMTFTEAERNATSNHLSLLGHGAWKHSLVLFIQETPAEEKDFEVQGKMLQWLVEKCGNRYHVLNTKKKDDVQVRELLEKIEDMVAENDRDYCEISRKILKDNDRNPENKRSERRTYVWKQKNSLRSLRGNPLPSGVRFVLLGFKGAGKSSSGNTILGREEFRSGQRSAVCVKRQGEVAGRQVTVVEAPGWWSYLLTEYSPAKLKKEIVLSPSLCDQGPHSFCVVVRVDTGFTEQHKKSIQQHVGLLSGRVWSHTMVLFTHGDWLGDTTIEQYIETEGENLHWLIEKCGNRYHVLNNQNRTDKTQVIELLEKIESMLVDKKGSVYKVDPKKTQQVIEWRKDVKNRAEKRMMMKKYRKYPGQSMEDIFQPSLRIVLLGPSHHGRSSSGNTILGREEFDLNARTAQCVKRQGKVAGRLVTVVEAPGWWYNVTFKNTPELTKQEILHSVSPCSPGPHVFLLVIRVDLSVTAKSRKVIQEHIELLCEDVWSHTMVLFTYGDCLGDATIEEHIESEGALQSLVDKCENRYHVFNNKVWSDGAQVTELLEKIEEMVAGNSGHHFEMDKKRVQAMEERRERQIQRAEDRQMRVYRTRTTLQFSVGDIPVLPELRLVLLGFKVSGKSTSGNTILGREEFQPGQRSAVCVKRQGEVAGRLVTVVDTPGWWKNGNLKPSRLTEEKNAVDPLLSPLEPSYAVALVIRADLHFTEHNGNIAQKEMELLGERVWSQAMVLFTHGDCLGDTTIEQHIESEGEALQSLVEKCGNSYHVLNNQNRTEDQVIQLLEKMEEMVVWKWYVEMDRKHQEDTEGNPEMSESSFVSQKRWRRKMDEVTDELELASMLTPPKMGGDDRSDISSLYSSGYGTQTPQTASECLSERGSVVSGNTQRSGIRGLRSGTRRRPRTASPELKLPEVRRLKPPLKKGIL